MGSDANVRIFTLVENSAILKKTQGYLLHPLLHPLSYNNTHHHWDYFKSEI